MWTVVDNYCHSTPSVLLSITGNYYKDGRKLSSVTKNAITNQQFPSLALLHCRSCHSAETLPTCGEQQTDRVKQRLGANVVHIVRRQYVTCQRTSEQVWRLPTQHKLNAAEAWHDSLSHVRSRDARWSCSATHMQHICAVALARKHTSQVKIWPIIVVVTD